MAETRGRGRHRSVESEESILRATLELLEEKPLREITIESIAGRAGVGKATIYKWWPTKAFVALDAFRRQMNRTIALPDTGSAERDFAEQLHSLSTFCTSAPGRIFAQFIAECQIDPEFAALFRERILRPRRELVSIILERGVERGEIDRNLDRELLLDLVYGAMVFRLMVGHAPLNREETDAMIHALFRGMSAQAGRRPALSSPRLRVR
jgi:AcrR family transcriptional regulator